MTGSFRNGNAALKALKEKTPELLFLDVQMPGMDGFELLANIKPEEMPVVIFVTAYDEFALRAFEAHALDYLLKSYSDDRFEAALARAKQQIRQRQTSAMTERLVAMIESHKHDRGHPIDERAHRAQAPSEPHLTRLVIKEGGRVFFVHAGDIDWIEAADYYVCLHVGNDSHLLRETMRRLDKRLDPTKFIRTHRSTIVNLDRIQELQPYQHGDYTILLHDGTKLKLSRGYRSRLEAALGHSI